MILELTYVKLSLLFLSTDDFFHYLEVPVLVPDSIYALLDLFEIVPAELFRSN